MYLSTCRPTRKDFWSGDLSNFFEDFLNVLPEKGKNYNWSPRTDLHESDKDFTLMLDLPGIEKEDIKINVEANVLTISGERKSHEVKDDKYYHREERVSGSFSRSFKLGKEVQADNIEATFKNGVLEIRLPKAEEVKPKEIEIKIN